MHSHISLVPLRPQQTTMVFEEAPTTAMGFWDTAYGNYDDVLAQYGGERENIPMWYWWGYTSQDKCIERMNAKRLAGDPYKADWDDTTAAKRCSKA